MLIRVPTAGKTSVVPADGPERLHPHRHPRRRAARRRRPAAPGSTADCSRDGGQPDAARTVDCGGPEGHGAICRARSPGEIGPRWLSPRVIRQMRSRSFGTRGDDLRGRGDAADDRGRVLEAGADAGPGPTSPPSTATAGHRAVRPAYVTLTRPMASAREACSSETRSAPVRTASVARPRTLTEPSGMRSTELGVSARWCRPRWLALSSALAVSPMSRRTSSAGRPPDCSRCESGTAPVSGSSTTNATPWSVPTSSTRTSRGSSTPAARRAASSVAAAIGDEAGKQTSTTSRSRVWSLARQRSWEAASDVRSVRA